jgi:DNA repair exonuclease SbcCD nuclease subunit
MNDVVALLCSDLHLSHTAPVARSAESDWYAAMARSLVELGDLQRKYDCPVLIAGDIFDRWNCPPSLINFALKYLPDNVYAIPGQHDLPLHRIEDLTASAYWTLVKAGKIENFDYRTNVNGMDLHGFSWGQRSTQVDVSSVNDARLQIAVVHAYVWIEDHRYPVADDVSHAGVYSDRLKGYDVALFGDNHKGFKTELKSGCTLFNAGTFMRRKADEVDYKPMVGLLKKDGVVLPYYLNTKEDEFDERHLSKLAESVETDMSEFLEKLQMLSSKNIDFVEILSRFMDSDRVTEAVRSIIVRVLEEME